MSESSKRTRAGRTPGIRRQLWASAWIVLRSVWCDVAAPPGILPVIEAVFDGREPMVSASLGVCLRLRLFGGYSGPLVSWRKSTSNFYR